MRLSYTELSYMDILRMYGLSRWNMLHILLLCPLFLVVEVLSPILVLKAIYSGICTLPNSVWYESSPAGLNRSNCISYVYGYCQ